MQNRLAKILLVSILFVLSLAACGSQPAETEEGPTAAYWAYFQACENGKYDSAVNYLTEEAKAQVESIGACGFTHDAINRVEAESTGIERTFSDDPGLDASEKSAVMTWIDDQGNLAMVHLVKDAEGWKVAYTVWSN